MASDDWRTTGPGPGAPETPAPHGAAPGDGDRAGGSEHVGGGDRLGAEPPPRGESRHGESRRDESPRNESPGGVLAGWWRDFAHAATFLTRIPFHVDRATAERPLADAARGFPIAGLVVGVVGAVALIAANALGLPSLASALIAVAATALVTGGLHEDGLADAVDGIVGGHDREDTLAIMHDSRIGAFGTLALIFVIALKVAALEALEPGAAAAALIGAEVAGRSVLPAVMFYLPPARSDGLSHDAGKPVREHVVLAALLGGALVLLMLGIAAGVVAVAVAAALAALIARAARARLGGHTGDVLGAIEQLTAVAVLLTAAAVV